MRRILLTAVLLGIAVSAGAQVPMSKPNPLGIKGFAGHQTETKGSITHLTGKAIVWFENSTMVIADEATINFEWNQIEFRGNVLMKPR